MSALAVAPVGPLERALAHDLRAGRVRPGPPARPPLPRVRPLVDPEPAVQPRPSSSGAPAPAHTLRTRIAVLRAADRAPVEAALRDDEPVSAPPDGDPRVLARTLALASVEALVGRRPVAQLARWLAPGVFDLLQARAHVTVRAIGPRASGRGVAVRTVRTCRIEPCVVEATAVVDDGVRVRAVAMRLEVHRRAWRVTALEIG
ncbi:Rv3235 family protein [Cellulomonas sp.]|uniref:Rv3235 family protein n=1 Tax=Cellulomonas sp. TaxID=40001 RepID=UPI00258C359E|nr:Rv3235 family protein [Cellulomonas sp.]MCR6690488.1 Rv3235 family protein [Cellulomonas sp.]